jgi:tryptophan synthase beta subunit
MSYNVNEKGYYGEFGGAYIPEMLHIKRRGITLISK